MKDSLLANYLSPGFSQRLIDRQNEINGAVRAYVEDRIMGQERGQANVLPNLRLLILKLRNGKLFSAYSRSKSPNDVP